MKTTLAIVCILVFGWTLFVQAQAPGAGVQHPTRACCKCSGARCCAARGPAQSFPNPAAPAPSNHIVSLPMMPAVSWLLPSTEAGASSFSSLLPIASPGVPIYRRGCAFLI